MFETLGTILNGDGFMPHGHCYLWIPSLVWTMVITDSLIFLAYAVISICLYALVKKIKLPFSGMFLAFGLFIAACGMTHLMEVYNLWVPNYSLAAAIKIVTATASVATAIWLFPTIPKVVTLAKTARLSEERRIKLEETTLQLQKQTLNLESVNQELEAFCYSVSHDLRAPLRSIVGFSSDVLEESGKDLRSQGIEDMQRVISSAKKMGELIDGLLGLSRLTQGEIKNETVNLSQIAAVTIEDLMRDEPERNVNFVLSEEIVVNGDASLLRAMMANLLSNAWKFTAKKPDAKIEFGKEESGGAPVYYVRDNGAGFDMRYVDKLFGAFQRLHSLKEFAGNGIGLATVQRIIRRHGGKVWAEAHLNEGATFYFTV